METKVMSLFKVLFANFEGCTKFKAKVLIKVLWSFQDMC